MRVLLAAGLALAAFSPGRWAWAEGHGVTVVNAGRETIRRIEIGTTDNRLRSQLPPGAQARITYSTGCQAEVRLGFEGGRVEAFPAVDVCTDPRVESGKGVTAAGSSAPAPRPTAATGSVSGATAVAVSAPVKAPPPIVPPWTGKSIMKRFGGLD